MASPTFPFSSEHQPAVSPLTGHPGEPALCEAQPPLAATVFGARVELAAAYAALLADRGRLVGVIGPREAGRIWSRHLLNCAVVQHLVPVGAAVADVGSGAGLPGLPLALARPDVRVSLIESLSRRVRFLREAVAVLGLGAQVEILHSRAEELTGRDFDVVTARAVAELPTLARWCLPLARRRTGLVLALRGEAAASELAGLRPSLRQLRATADLHELPGVPGEPPTRVVALART